MFACVHGYERTLHTKRAAATTTAAPTSQSGHLLLRLSACVHLILTLSHFKLITNNYIHTYRYRYIERFMYILNRRVFAWNIVRAIQFVDTYTMYKYIRLLVVRLLEIEIERMKENDSERK